MRMTLRPRRLALLGALSLLGGVASAQESAPSPLRPGETLSGTLAPGEMVSLSVESPNGQRLHVRTQSSDFTPRATLHLPSGDALTGEGDTILTHANCCRSATLDLVIEASEASGGGAFTITVEAEPFEVAAGGRNVEIGERVQGRLAPGDRSLAGGAYADSYVFSGQVGQRVNLTATSEQFDPFLRLMCPCGQLSEDDDSGGRLSARISLMIHEPGLHRVDVTTVEPRRTGDYTLTIESP